MRVSMVQMSCLGGHHGGPGTTNSATVLALRTRLDYSFKNESRDIHKSVTLLSYNEESY